jgi:hypothetical protein
LWRYELEEGVYLMSDPLFERYQKNGLNYPPPKPTGGSGQAMTDDVQEEQLTFSQELQHLLNKHSMENLSGTPDWILMEYLRKCLETWDACIMMRADWRGESVELPALQKLHEGKHTVPVVVYVNGRRNEIGEAEIKVWPGEAYNGALVEQVISVFESGSKEFIEASEGQVDAGMQKGLVSAEPMQELDQFGGIAGLEREEVDNGRGSEPESGSVTS